jgi:hypothetical protein
LAKNDAVVPTAEAESLLDLAGHGHLGPVAGQAEVLAHDPNASAPIVHLKNAIAKAAEGIGGLAADGDLFSGEVGGVTIDIGDRSVCGTSHQARNREYEYCAK